MLFLILAILSSAMVSIGMRLSSDKISANLSMLAVNYLICAFLGALYAGFELWVDRKRLRMALAMADAVAAENMGDELWFTLVYKKEHLVK